jgi:hypothetical protein
MTLVAGAGDESHRDGDQKADHHLRGRQHDDRRDPPKHEGRREQRRDHQADLKPAVSGEQLGPTTTHARGERTLPRAHRQPSRRVVLRLVEIDHPGRQVAATVPHAGRFQNNTSQELR